MKSTVDAKTIDTLRDLPDMIPVLRDYYEGWTIRIFNREQHDCRNYLSPNRRDFYKALLITKGSGIFTMGLNTYHVDEPTLLFIHPNDIISWRRLSEQTGGYYVLFRRSFISDRPQLQAVIDRYGLFTDKTRSVIRLKENEVPVINRIFQQMEREELADSGYLDDALQAYMQLLMVESMRIGDFPKPQSVSGDFRQIHEFFNLLEKETSNINYSTPIRIRTAKEFASVLNMHPNYLNELLKKHTGQNASTHIRNRILEEAKVLLVRTDWPLKDVATSIGFAEQPNFNLFFKKNTGLTPASFRKNHQSAERTGQP